MMKFEKKIIIIIIIIIIIKCSGSYDLSLCIFQRAKEMQPKIRQEMGQHGSGHFVLLFLSLQVKNVLLS